MSWSIPWSSGLKRIRRGWSPGSLFRDRQPLWECFVRSWISSISWHVTILNWIETEGYSVDGPVVLDDSGDF